MKALTKIIVASSLSIAAVQAVAGPPPDFWQRSRPMGRAATATPAQPAPAVPTSLTCAKMLVPDTGFGKGQHYHWVTCTPEMLQKDWRCQQACASAAKG